MDATLPIRRSAPLPPSIPEPTLKHPRTGVDSAVLRG